MVAQSLGRRVSALELITGSGGKAVHTVLQLAGQSEADALSAHEGTAGAVPAGALLVFIRKPGVGHA